MCPSSCVRRPRRTRQRRLITSTHCDLALGQAVLIQVQDVLLRISGMPEIHGIVWRNVRAARLRRFTYVVYYRVHADRLEVLAVVQGNRDAAVWQSRE